jgi:hypothetical protein
VWDVSYGESLQKHPARRSACRNILYYLEMAAPLTRKVSRDRDTSQRSLIRSVQPRIFARPSSMRERRGAGQSDLVLCSGTISRHHLPRNQTQVCWDFVKQFYRRLRNVGGAPDKLGCKLQCRQSNPSHICLWISNFPLNRPLQRLGISIANYFDRVVQTFSGDSKLDNCRTPAESACWTSGGCIEESKP